MLDLLGKIFIREDSSASIGDGFRMYMLHWGKSLLLPLPLTGESFDNFVPN